MAKQSKTIGMGRKKVICTVCGKEFSTHSSNRSHCYNCRKKCTEIHYFDVLKENRKKNGKKNKNNL